jgi:phosphoribosylamine--glycine ligase
MVGAISQKTLLVLAKFEVLIKNYMAKLKPAVIGKDGRTTAIKYALELSPKVSEVISLDDWKVGTQEEAKVRVLENAKRLKPDFIVIGPEEPLAAGIVDMLEAEGIPCIGPIKALAKLESSKAFTRNLLAKYGIPGNPEFRVFYKMDGVGEYLQSLGGFVIKPDGLTGGKGVKISDAHLFSLDEAIAYCREIFSEGHEAVVIEEKLEGEEFSLMSLCDGLHVSDMVVVQDHKRIGEGDTGPNTGGMGSYSCENHRLPFLSADMLRQASEINKAVAKALLAETEHKYKGVLYGGFMLTPNGLRLLEYNARFGDPETLNALSILETDFADVCMAIINERLDKVPLCFSPLATVCKYIVPQGYPDNPVKDVTIDLRRMPKQSKSLRIYRAAVADEHKGKCKLTGSRAIAFVGIGKNLREAEIIAEEAANSIDGPVIHRRDIGTEELIERRVAHIKSFSSRSDLKTVKC